MNAAIAGTFPPNLAPVPRSAVEIGCDLAAAAPRLASLAARVINGADASTDLDMLGAGVCRLACELRAGGRE